VDHLASGARARSHPPDPLPQKPWVAAFNLAVTNRITSRFAARLPGFGILTHVGRKSGWVYRTPVNVFRAPEEFLIALTYGRESEWVRNVIAAEDASLKLVACSISFPHQRSCMIPFGDGFPFLCGSCSDSSARTISCSFQLPSRVAVSTSQRCSSAPKEVFRNRTAKNCHS
jgi:hypothetical protein